MKITWLGHSCYLLENSNEVSLAIDPFDPSIGYDAPTVKADLVTTSHDHHDHNAVDQLMGDPKVISKKDPIEVLGFNIKGISSYHDDDKGNKRGENIIFIYDVDNLRIVHLGDLGHMLDKDKITSLGKVDILFVPVGSVYTIDGEQANELVKKISPTVTIPMHYKTPKLNIDLRPVDDFLNLADEYQQLNTNEVEITTNNINSFAPIVVLQPPK
ncbi:MAG: MBL fold metallo-hydrolase [Clostridia bacterium]